MESEIFLFNGLQSLEKKFGFVESNLQVFSKSKAGVLKLGSFFAEKHEILDISTRKSDENLFFALHFGIEQNYYTKGVHATSNTFLGVCFAKV